jgi:putative addiction module component (TIGR02574 family)
MDLVDLLARVASLTGEERLRWIPAVLATLSVEERIPLAQDIWDSIADRAAPDLTESRKRELDRRIADLDAHPENVLTREQIEAGVRRRR